MNVLAMMMYGGGAGRVEEGLAGLFRLEWRAARVWPLSSKRPAMMGRAAVKPERVCSIGRLRLFARDAAQLARAVRRMRYTMLTVVMSCSFVYGMLSGRMETISKTTAVMSIRESLVNPTLRSSGQLRVYRASGRSHLECSVRAGNCSFKLGIKTDRDCRKVPKPTTVTFQNSTALKR